jgi:magnesium transporter
MARLVQKRSETIGLPPGTLVYIGDRPAKEIKITLATYNNQEYAESRQESLRECLLTKDPSYITWVDVSGLHQVKDLEYLGKCLNLHPLVLEDILNSDQRPKLEDYGTYLFLVLKMLHLKEQTDEVLTEQVSVIVGENFVISLSRKRRRRL